MGNTEDCSRKAPQSTVRSKVKILLLVIVTNALTVCFLSSAPFSAVNLFPITPTAQLSALQRDLNSTQSKLADLQRRIQTTNSLLEAFLSYLGRQQQSRAADEEGWREELSGELKLAVGPHKLPLGFTSNLGSDEIYPTMGASCSRLKEEVVQYMTYEVGGDCPSDEAFAQQLMLKGCEPLPRRRCHPRSPANYAGPAPFPASMWTIPPDTSIVWDAYTCKNYSCLVHRNAAKGSYDCKDCFDLGGREKDRWLRDDGGLDYGIDAVLAGRTVRIGLDVGGGTGTFAARMRERNVTVVTSSMNFDGPFNSFIAARGLVPLHISVAHRLPFFDGTLDLVHSMHVLSNWIPDAVLEFALFDIYRVLRPGGVFWLDHFFCVGAQLNGTYGPMFGRIGFNKIRWTTGRKLDRGIHMDEWYLSALLEKPTF